MNIFDEISLALRSYMSSEHPEVAQAAAEADRLTGLLESNQISRQEYQELLQDTLDLERVTELMVNQERKQEVAAALDLVKRHLGSLISLIV